MTLIPITIHIPPNWILIYRLRVGLPTGVSYSIAALARFLIRLAWLVVDMVWSMNFEAAGISILLCRFGVFRLLSFCWDLHGEAGRRRNSEG